MKIDISRMNLLEKDIEDWLYENPKVITRNYEDDLIAKWIGRQYQLPSGIADLIGVRASGRLVVIEVKNVAINKAAILQVCRYARDLKEIVSTRMDYPHIRDWNEPVVDMVLVGPSIDSQTFTEAKAVGVWVYQFSVEMKLDIGLLQWGSEHYDSIRAQYESIAAKPEWEIYGLTISEDIEQRQHEKEADASASEDDALPDEYDEIFERIKTEAIKYNEDHKQDEGDDVTP